MECMKPSQTFNKDKERILAIVEDRKHTREQKCQLLLDMIHEGKDVALVSPKNEPEFTTAWMFWHGNDELFYRAFARWKPCFETLFVQALTKDPTRALHLIELGCPVHRCKNVFLDHAWKNRELLNKLLEFGVGWKRPHTVEDIRNLGYKNIKELGETFSYVESYKASHLVKKPFHPSHQKINWQAFAVAYLCDKRHEALDWIKKNHHKIDLIELLKRERGQPHFVDFIQAVEDRMTKDQWRDLMLGARGIFDAAPPTRPWLKEDALLCLYEKSLAKGFPHALWAQKEKELKALGYRHLWAIIEKHDLVESIQDHVELKSDTTRKRKI